MSRKEEKEAGSEKERNGRKERKRGKEAFGFSRIVNTKVKCYILPWGKNNQKRANIKATTHQQQASHAPTLICKLKFKF